MDLTIVRKKFFEKYPNSIASIVYNDNLGCFIVFTYDFENITSFNTVIDEQTKNDLFEFAKHSDKAPLLIFSEFLNLGKFNNDQLEIISNYLLDCYNGKQNPKSLEEICRVVNTYTLNSEDKKASNKSRVSAFILNDNCEPTHLPIFNMDISYRRTKSGKKVCYIENTFTEKEYRGAGVHSYGIKFLEAILSRKNFHSLMGKSEECEIYDETRQTNLNNHYKNMGFNVLTNSLGESFIVKQVEQDNNFPITKDDFETVKE